MSEGYVSETVRAKVRTDAGNRCGDCLSPQHLVLGWLEIEHIIPTACGGPDEENNLWLACRLCNTYKAAQTEALDPVTNQRVALFNPRQQRWSDHFSWDEDGTRILGRTPSGRATVLAFQLNNAIAVTVRSYWIEAGWHPPDDLL